MESEVCIEIEERLNDDGMLYALFVNGTFVDYFDNKLSALEAAKMKLLPN